MSLHKPTVFTGAATALITPFLGGEVDYGALGNMIDAQLENGINGILVTGTTGEGSTLTLRECVEITRFAKARIGSQVPLLAGCGSNCTAHAVELARALSEAGADALLAVTPYYNKTTDVGILHHYRAIADVATCPLVLYNVPSRTGFSMTVEHYRALASHKNIVAVKEASGDLCLLAALCDECGDRLDVYTGNDHQTVASMRLGAVGVISVISNLLPREMVELCRLCQTGDYRSAALRHRALLERMRMLFEEVNPVPVKYVASLKGLCTAEYRLPLCPPSPELARKLQRGFG